MAYYLCVLWRALFYDLKNRGKIYNDFLIDRLALIAHLKNCKDCRQLVGSFQANVGTVPNFSSMTENEFSIAIRKLWNLARRKKRK